MAPIENVMEYEFEMSFNNGAIIKNQQSFICQDTPVEIVDSRI